MTFTTTGAMLRGVWLHESHMTSHDYRVMLRGVAP